MKTVFALIVYMGFLASHAHGSHSVSPLWEKSRSKLDLRQVTIKECADSLLIHYKKESLLFAAVPNDVFKYKLPEATIKKRRDVSVPQCSFGEALSLLVLTFGVSMNVSDSAIIFGDSNQSDLFVGVKHTILTTLTGVQLGDRLEGLAGKLKLGRVQISLTYYNVRKSILQVHCAPEDYQVLRSVIKLTSHEILLQGKSVSFERARPK